MRKHYLLIAVLLLSKGLAAVTLQDCLQGLRESSPITKNVMLAGEQQEYKDKGLQTVYYPSLSINAEAGINSEVTEMSLGSAVPLKVPKPDKDRESIGVELKQLIWDGGITKAQRQMSNLESKAKVLDYQASLVAAEMEVINLYYAIVSLSLSMSINTLQLDTQNSRLSTIETGVEGGIRESADLLLLQNDILGIKDRIDSFKQQKQAAITRLMNLCRIELAADTEFGIPELPIMEHVEINRPELEKLSTLAELQRANARLAKRKNLPQISARLSAAIGKPGFDMFSTEYHDYYAAGVMLSWRVWDFGQRNYESRIAGKEAEQLEKNRENMLTNIQNELINIDKDEEHLRRSLESSRERIRLLESVQRIYEEKYALGMITTTELLAQSNNLLGARLELENSQTKLSALMAKRLCILGEKI